MHRLSLAAFCLPIHPRTWDCITIADFVLSSSSKTPLHHLCSFKTEDSIIFNSKPWKQPLEVWKSQELEVGPRKWEAPAKAKHQMHLILRQLESFKKYILITQVRCNFRKIPKSLFRVICPLTNRWISMAACLWQWNALLQYKHRIALWIFVAASFWNKKFLLIRKPRQHL